MKHLLLIIVAAAALSYSGCQKQTEKKNDPASEKSAKSVSVKEVRIVKPVIKNLSVTIKEGVTLAPEEQGAVTSDLTATLVKWHVEENQKVKAGQAIATLDAIDYQIQLESQKAQLAALQATYAGVENDYNRLKRLLEKDSIPKQQVDSVEANYFAMKKNIEATENGVKLMERRVGQAVVRAPFSGIITKKIVSLGTKIIIAMPGSGDIAYIEKNDRLKVSMNISEQFFSEIKEGMEIDFFIPSLNRKVKGNVHSKGNTINNMKKFNIITYIDNKDGLIPSGSFAFANIQTPEKERTIVPAMAVKSIGENKGEIFTVTDGKITSVEVYIDHAFEDGVSIIGDLPETVIKDISSVAIGEKVSPSL